MAQIFGPQSNWMARTSLVAIPLAILLALTVAEGVDRSPYVTEQNKYVDQPVPFSHQHHAGELGIDCRYCHTQVEQGAHAAIPPSATCMTCHSQILSKSQMLAPVRESYARDEALKWNKVTKLPEYVYFNHSIHVQKGVACASCHGRMEEMPLTQLQHPMQMQFCLNCHRDPTDKLRPPEAVTDVTYDSRLSEAERAELSEKVAHDLNVHSRMDCITCHR